LVAQAGAILRRVKKNKKNFSVTSLIKNMQLCLINKTVCFYNNARQPNQTIAAKKNQKKITMLATIVLRAASY
jgi:hypothetical protein